MRVSNAKSISAVLAKIVLGFVLTWVLGIGVRLGYHATQSIDAIVILGGSINREIYGATQHFEQPEIPVLISGGSAPPCLHSLFNASAPSDQVWLEPCARSTFDNFWYSIPILKQWKAKKVELVSSGSHYSRAIIMGRILLGAQGIWVKGRNVEEPGIPGNQEYWWKTLLDCLRAMLWAIGSQAYNPKCSGLIPLQDVDLEEWDVKGFSCEHHPDLNQLRTLGVMTLQVP